MHVIALAQQKGGVSKSTLAIHIAAEAHTEKRPAVIIELDRQGTASAWGDARKAAGFGKPDVMRQDANQLEQTLQVMRGLGVSVVVLDLPGSANPAVNAAIKMADLVLLPSRPQETDIVASAEPLAAVQRLRKPYAYVLTFVEGKGGRADETKRELEAQGHAVAGQFMWRRQEYVDALVAGRTAKELKPKSKGAEEIANLWVWIKKELEHGHASEADRDQGRGQRSA